MHVMLFSFIYMLLLMLLYYICFSLHWLVLSVSLCSSSEDMSWFFKWHDSTLLDRELRISSISTTEVVKYRSAMMDYLTAT